MKYDSDEPHKQGGAADAVDFISHLYGASGLWPAFAFHACKMIVLAILTESTSKDFQHLAKAYSVS